MSLDTVHMEPYLVRAVNRALEDEGEEFRVGPGYVGNDRDWQNMNGTEKRRVRSLLTRVLADATEDQEEAQRESWLQAEGYAYEQTGVEGGYAVEKNGDDLTVSIADTTCETILADARLLGIGLETCDDVEEAVRSEFLAHFSGRYEELMEQWREGYAQN